MMVANTLAARKVRWLIQPVRKPELPGWFGAARGSTIATLARCASRYRYVPDHFYYPLGFRVALSPG